MTIKAAGYSRLSKEDVNKSGWDSESIKNQHYLIKEYAEKQGWQLVEIYSDDDFKGSDRNRPAFNRLLSDMYAHKFQVIICKSQSRFARDIELIEKYIHGIFLEENIRFVTIEDHIDTASMNSSSKKISQLHGLTDTWYLEDLSHNISDVLDIKRKKGEYIGSWPLYGYLKKPEDKNQLIIDPVAAEVVRSIYRMYVEGYGLQRIANHLNQRNIPNPLKYKRDAGMKIGAKSRMTSKSFLWRNDTIGRILDNQMYIGDMVQGKLKKASYKSKKLIRLPEEDWIIAQGKHPPIIDQATWELVRSIRKSRIKPRRDGLVNPFSGKIRCLECQELMYAVTYPRQVGGEKSKTEFNTTFRCSKKMINKEACPATGISMAVIEKNVVIQLKKLWDLYFDEEYLRQRLTIEDRRQEAFRKLQEEQARLQRLLEENSQTLTALYMDKVKGLLSEKQFLQISRQIEESSGISEEALEEVRQDIRVLAEQTQEQTHQESLLDVVVKYKDLEELDRNLVVDLIDVIYVGREDLERNERILQIFWNF